MKNLTIPIIILLLIFNNTSLCSEIPLSEGDVLIINVKGYPQYSSEETIIGSDGKISFPLIGSIAVHGLTSSQLAEVIRQKLIEGNYLKNPQVSVILVKTKSRLVSVLGRGVDEPGTYTLEGKTRIMEIVAGAKPNDKAMMRSISITRGTEQIKVNLENLLNKADMTQNLLLMPGDVINVPEDRESFAFILGEVNNPGPISIKGGITLAEAIASAGGHTERANLRRITVSHNGKPPLEIDFNRFLIKGDLSQNIKVSPGNVVNIPQDTENFVNVLGKVKNPGKINIPSQGMDLLQALARAGGVTEEARLSHIRIISLNSTIRRFDLKQVFQTGDTSSLPQLSAGDTILVPEKPMIWQKFAQLVAEIILVNTAISIIRGND
ncbi:hypothetical protein GF312_11765 [Candidatus Poribacteria bacterium]|nr:hypothetical protein [Candidatus Poribacteria bacterium]